MKRLSQISRKTNETNINLKINLDGNGTSVVIVGYDEYNTWLYDPVKQETYPYGMNDSTDLFQKAGNIFITYIESVNY